MTSQEIVYRKPDGVDSGMLNGRPTLSTAEGGRVVVDHSLLKIWELADGSSLEGVVNRFQAPGATPGNVRAALACLAEAGLLHRTKGFSSQHGEPAVAASGPGNRELVSAVIVDHHSREWLEACIPSLLEQTYSPIEIILVDNTGSGDSLDWAAQSYPGVNVIRLEKPGGLAYALNRGVEQAAGSYYLLLNPDVRLDPQAVGELVSAASSAPDFAAAAAKLRFWWAPAFLNGLGNRVGAFSWGTDNGLGHLDLGQFDGWQRVPSVCFAAALIGRDAWDKVGPLDERLQLYYEDAEWSYRARSLGYELGAAPNAEALHAFGSRTHTGEEVDLTPEKLAETTYGRLRFALKIIPRQQLFRFLSGYLFEDSLNLLRELLRFDFRRAASVWTAWTRVVSDWPEIRSARRRLVGESSHEVQDLFALQRDFPPPFIWRGLPELTWDAIVHHYSLLIEEGKTREMPEFKSPAGKPKLLIVSNDVIDRVMAGPGMRYVEMARALAPDLQVTVAVPKATDLEVPGIRLAPYQPQDAEALKELAAGSDVILISSFILEKFPFLNRSTAPLVVDLYDPFILENLHYYSDEPAAEQRSLNDQAVGILNRLIQAGDFFICASERQRDFWLGVLAANGRVNPDAFEDDPSLRKLIDVVGIGFPDREPQSKPMLRGRHPAISQDARIVLWGGGIWDWLDPITLIEAWPAVLSEIPDARLVFLGTKHPNPLVPRHKIAALAEERAEGIGERDRTILFFEWLAYEDREALLCEADVGVTLHPQHIETRFSIRTRVLDYFWAHLPVLVNEGDVASDWVREYGLGEVVPSLDRQATEKALVSLLATSKDSRAAAFEALRAEFSWNHVVKPLREYCKASPKRGRRSNTNGSALADRRGTTWKSSMARARYILRSDGLRVMLHRAWRYIQLRLSRL